MTATDSGALEMTAEREGKRHRVTVKQGDSVLLVDLLNVAIESARKKFLKALTTKSLSQNLGDRM